MTLQDLEGGDFIDTHDPDALFCQPGRIPIAPKDLLRSLFELGIQAGRLPIAGAMSWRSTALKIFRTVRGPSVPYSHPPPLDAQVITRPMSV